MTTSPRSPGRRPRAARPRDRRQTRHRSRRPTSRPRPDAETVEEPAGSDGASLLQDAYDGKLTVRCTFEQEGYKGTSYIKSSAHLRMDMDSPEGEMHILKLDTTTYMWGASLPQGMKFETQDLDESFAEQFEQFTPEDFEESAEENNVKCEEHPGDDSMFDVPADVSFSAIGDPIGS